MYLINGVSGRVLYKFFEKKVRLDLPIDLILSEHMLIMSFQREGANQLTHQEISVTEMYSQRVDDNTKKLLLEYYKGEERLHEHHFTSFQTESPVVI